MGEYTRQMIENIADNEKEWREHILTLITDIRTDVKAQNSRVRKLENWRWYVIGVVVGVVFVMNMLWR